MDKTVVVSGAGGALGSVITQHFAKNGYRVSGLYRHIKHDIENQDIKQYSTDLLDEDSIAGTLKLIVDDHKKIDVLVCTAGGFSAGDIQSTRTEDMEKQYRLNFMTVYNLVHPVYLQMKKQGYGRIFLIGSRQGLDASQSTHTIAYGLSKSLLFHLAGMLNKDGAGKVITTVVVPSTIDTPANRSSMPDADYGKWVSPEKIADIIYFYSSASADPIRNPIIRVFGDS